MIVEYFEIFQKPVQASATQVIVRDLFGDPLAIVIEHVPGQYFVTKRGDPDFQKHLTALGLPNIVITEQIEAPQPTRSLVLP